MSDHVTIDPSQFEPFMKQMLTEYGDEADRAIRDILPQLGKEGVSKIKSLSPSGHRRKGKYKTTWTSTVLSGRLYARLIIHQRAGKKFQNWRLVHLLVKGHMSRTGKFVPPSKEHYQPTAKFVEEEFVKRLIKELRI